MNEECILQLYIESELNSCHDNYYGFEKILSTYIDLNDNKCPMNGDDSHCVQLLQTCFASNIVKIKNKDYIEKILKDLENNESNSYKLLNKFAQHFSLCMHKLSGVFGLFHATSKYKNDIIEAITKFKKVINMHIGMENCQRIQFTVQWDIDKYNDTHSIVFII